jgi:hypothetical protein
LVQSKESPQVQKNSSVIPQQTVGQSAQPTASLNDKSGYQNLEPEKSSMNYSIMEKSSSATPAILALNGGEEGEERLAEPAEIELGAPEPVIETEAAAAPLPEGMPVMLQRGKAPRRVRIGNFSPITLDGDAEECVAVGTSMVASAGGAEDLLDVMAADDRITVAKICAENGSIILMCRGGKFSINPRKPHPTDGCKT